MPEPEKKTKIVTLRFQQSALIELDAQAKAVNLTRSAYIIRKLTGLSVLPTRVPAINWQLYRELATLSASLNAIGNNINQIARVLNTAQVTKQPIPKSLPQPQSIEDVLDAIKEISPYLTEVRLLLSGVKPQPETESSSMSINRLGQQIKS